MKNILAILFVFLLFIIAFQMWGCAAALAPTTIITSVELASDLAKKVNELHASGVDKKTLDEVHGIISDAHELISVYHKKHVEDE